MNKSILITGSSRGIGKAIAQLAHKQEYTVVVHGKTDSKELQKIHQELSGSVKTFFDVSDKQATHDAINKVLREIKPIDVLVNNAGIAKNFLKGIEEVDDEQALNEYKVNVLGTIHCIQAVMPKMGSVNNLV